jgi:formylmethanofuran dehydrogenase subunit E
VLGVHLAERGMEVIGTNDPKKMIVYVENDRCIADAIQILTGTRLGRRSMKLMNYGKMAATFINTQTGASYRVWVSGKINEMIGKVDLPKEDKKKQYELVLQLPSDDVVSVQKVVVNIPPEEMPGKPKRTVICVQCGEKVMDGKDITTPEGSKCLACSQGSYYSISKENSNAIGD